MSMIEKMKAQQHREPYKWIVPAFEWMEQDTKHMNELNELIKSEINLFERATNGRVSLLEKWGMPHVLWYALSYRNASYQHRLNCETLLHAAQNDADPAHPFSKLVSDLRFKNARSYESFTGLCKRIAKIERSHVRSQQLVKKLKETPIPANIELKQPALRPNSDFLGGDTPF